MGIKTVSSLYMFDTTSGLKNKKIKEKQEKKSPALVFFQKYLIFILFKNPNVYRQFVVKMQTLSATVVEG